MDEQRPTETLQTDIFFYYYYYYYFYFYEGQPAAASVFVGILFVSRSLTARILGQERNKWRKRGEGREEKGEETLPAILNTLVTHERSF